ncbi:MAG: helix-hairpin-helix domain-containing protein [Thermoleophilia bacterium]|nr:helix-hairpin-helix domain-containing protein [Thermoleophilia bacterium]
MHAIPTRRLLVYIAIGVVVLVVGTVGLVSMRGEQVSSAEAVVISAGDTVQGPAGALTLSGSTGVANPGVAIGVGGEAGAVATTTTEARIWVQVAGAVNRPGVYQMSAEARVFEAVAQAGGFSDTADQQAVALAACLSDGCRVYVPEVGEAGDGAVQTPVQSSAGLSGTEGGAEAGAASSPGPVSLNSGTLAELDALPGVGPAIAQQIITYRENNGPFTSVDQLTDVPGIGPAKLEQLRPLVGL